MNEVEAEIVETLAYPADLASGLFGMMPAPILENAAEAQETVLPIESEGGDAD